MYKQEFQIYSDSTNHAVLQAPGRHYPGSLVQGDTLYALCRNADDACSLLKAKNIEEAYEELNELRNSLWERLIHYKQVLKDHEIDLPFEVP